ncbi:hypothetical protein [Candidatus Pantoea multigeneris]|uniref:Uncharacterized protein n=1 Tax=Candidatus Pantoea multigeneris TaxID=2608357 RepID=A0ABX0RCF4_9GAMM|nr:hypothetical protein [Pantoea multigeneris]NIF23026.1 hypothetical protein [Pantoea multigeneris]
MTLSRRKLFRWIVPSATLGWLVRGQVQAAQPVQPALQNAVYRDGEPHFQLAADTSTAAATYSLGTTYSSGTVGAKLNRFVTIEDFADTNSANGNWAVAIKNAIDYARVNGIRNVYGANSYTISSTIVVEGLSNNGLNISIGRLVASSTWPKNTTLWDATPMLLIGDTVANITGLNLTINMLDGAGVADGIQATQYGFALSSIHIGDARNCVRVISNGNQQWPNASVQVSGDFWTANWLGIYLSRGTKGSSPISEGWKINVKFIANNRYGGILARGGSQYTQIRGDHDYNGRYLSLLQIDALDGITRGMKITNGTTQAEVLVAWQAQGQYWLAVMETKDVSAGNGGKSSYSVNDKLTSPTTTIRQRTITAVQTGGDNASATNYFDVLHDFEGEPFAKLQATMGYCSGIIGSLQFTSMILMQNSFQGITDNLRGLGVANSGTALSLYNRAVSDTPFANITSSFVNFQSKLYMQNRLYEGTGVAQTVTRSTSTYTTLFTLQPTATDRYLGEQNLYKVYIKTNYPGVCGEYLISVSDNTSDALQAHAVISNDGVFVWRVSGSNFQVRQEAADSIQFVANILRV